MVLFKNHCFYSLKISNETSYFSQTWETLSRWKSVLNVIQWDSQVMHCTLKCRKWIVWYNLYPHSHWNAFQCTLKCTYTASLCWSSRELFWAFKHMCLRGVFSTWRGVFVYVLWWKMDFDGPKTEMEQLQFKANVITDEVRAEGRFERSLMSIVYGTSRWSPPDGWGN